MNIVRTAAGIIGEFLVTAGLCLLLFVAWELWWTNIAADNLQEQAVSEFAQSQEVPVPRQSDEPYGPPAVALAPDVDGSVFGIVYIPRFGPGYSRPLVQGTTPAVLDTLGLGHYKGTSMPGEAGNFAVAGHRQTHGAVLDSIQTLVPGDHIYVQTKDGYYTYVFRNHEVVLPTGTDVLLPVPGVKGGRPGGSFLTMTSCNPRFGSVERIIAYSMLESWQPAQAGPPAAIEAQVTATRKEG